MWLLFACASPLSDTTPYITEAQVVAVQVEPAEAEAGQMVSLRTLYADASGALSDATLDWFFCTARKPLAELGPVATSCLSPNSVDLEEIGTGLDVSGVIPESTCSLFGPNPPPSEEGEDAGRPADPDITGGYYQPALGFTDAGGVTLASVRIRCGLADVSQDIYVAWNQFYHSNQNPMVSTISVDGAVVSAGDTPLNVTAGQTYTLTAAWPTCPDVGTCGDSICSADEDVTICSADCTTPLGCGGAETYVLYQADSNTLNTHREAISATWFTTGGVFSEARNGRASEDLEVEVENEWTAPNTTGEVWLAVVLRDERGGVGFTELRLIVE